MGIRGRFLAVLQALHANKKATLDLDGELLGEQDIECGVLQGNPLSPLLFNIYIDGVLRDIEHDVASVNEATQGTPAGIALLPVQGMDARRSVLSSLFYADDGVLLARDGATLRRLLAAVDTSLERVGLLLNAKKTKVMIVPKLGTERAEYDELVKRAVDGGGFRVRGQEVAIVDDFVYLGVKITWQWTWTAAWVAALARAKSALYLLRQAGFQNQGLQMVHQLRLAASSVLTHIDYVAALAGVDGYTDEIKKCQRVCDSLLRTIAGLRAHSCAAALSADAGVWSMMSRVRMLQFRFYVKLSCAPATTTHSRALQLSRLMAVHSGSLIDGVQMRTWAARSFVWRCLQTAALFTDASVSFPGAPISLQAASGAHRPVLALAVVQRLHARDEWLDVRADAIDQVGQTLRLRSTSTQGAFSIDYSTGATATTWLLPTGTRVSEALTRWTDALRFAVHASLRRRANVFRATNDKELPAHHECWQEEGSWMRDFVRLQGGSHMGWWWHVPQVEAARRLQKARLGEWGDEHSFRRVDKKATKKSRRLPRLESPSDRVCYLCRPQARDAAPLHVETVAHLLVECSHPVMVTRRAAIVQTLQDIAAQASTLDGCPPAPNWHDPQALYVVLMGGTGPGLLSHSSARDASFELDRARILVACRWTTFLTTKWTDGLQREILTEPSRQFGQLGGTLASAIAAHSSQVFFARRNALAAADDFLNRTLDPGYQPAAPPPPAVH